jgi:hypothetical protein
VTTSSTKKLLSVLSESLLEVEVMSEHSGFRVQLNVVEISKLTSRWVQLEVELMNKHRRLSVLLEVLKMIEYNR